MGGRAAAVQHMHPGDLASRSILWRIVDFLALLSSTRDFYVLESTRYTFQLEHDLPLHACSSLSMVICFLPFNPVSHARCARRVSETCITSR